MDPLIIFFAISTEVCKSTFPIFLPFSNSLKHLVSDHKTNYAWEGGEGGERGEGRSGGKGERGEKGGWERGEGEKERGGGEGREGDRGREMESLAKLIVICIAQQFHSSSKSTVPAYPSNYRGSPSQWHS